MLAYSGVADHDAVIGMLRAGASGYVVRDAPTEKLAAALRDAASGDSIFDDVVGRGLIHELLDQVRDTNRARDERARKRARIRSVMQNGELDIVFQPIVDLDVARGGRPRGPRRASPATRGAARSSGSPRRTRSGSASSWSCGRCAWPASARAGCRRRRFMAVNVSPGTAERPDLLALLELARTWTTWCSR